MKSDAKKEYWNTLYDLDYADISIVDKDTVKAYGDDIPEDVFSSPKGYIKGSQNLSSDKIQILNQIKSQKLLESIDNHLKTIKTYISVVFWISVASAAILVLSAIIKLL